MRPTVDWTQACMRLRSVLLATLTICLLGMNAWYHTTAGGQAPEQDLGDTLQPGPGPLERQSDQLQLAGLSWSSIAQLLIQPPFLQEYLTPRETFWRGGPQAPSVLCNTRELPEA